jgi:hypothetical protein
MSDKSLPKERKRPALSGWAVALLVMVILGYFGFNWLASGLCANQITKEEISPDGQLKALVFTRDCGATTSDSTQVSIIEASDSLPNEAGNVFIEDAGSSHASLDVSVRWNGARKLLITGDPKARVFRHENRIGIYRRPFGHESVEVEYHR